jgi:abortive infection alpha-like protein
MPDQNEHGGDSNNEVTVPLNKEEAALVKQAGEFMARLLGPAINNLAEIAHLQTQLWKIQNIVRIKKKFDVIVQREGPENFEYLRPRIAIPSIYSAANEDNDDIQDMWARLLAEAMRKSNDYEHPKSYVSVLEQFEPRDAQFFDILWSLILNSTFKHSQQGEDNSKVPGYIQLCKDYSAQLSTWKSIKTLERLGVVRLDELSDSDNFFDEHEGFWIPLRLGVLCEDGKHVEDDSLLKIKISLTELGLSFAQAVKGPLGDEGSRIISLETDKFHANKKTT